MDTSASGERPAPVPGGARRTPLVTPADPVAVLRAERLAALGAETRTSALLLGACLGSMGLFAVTLLLLTSWPAGR
ncbi:MAG: hypothetical protein QOE01_1585 [Actinomycetota bacterium]|jgi:hypothetical protein|nr:hypothetical protein [Actinomycetota bacterium]